MDEIFKKGTLLNLAEMVDYEPEGVVSKQILKNEAGNITLFSFDARQGLSEHTSPFHAVLEGLEGEAEIYIGEEKLILLSPQWIIMPAHVPHAIKAVTPFKMLLTMIHGV
ncbi:MAG: cupin domain-containing protein [Planctomycetia bacterium]|nr:cupin domain-containing protein [Planctomycetia bacterium]